MRAAQTHNILPRSQHLGKPGPQMSSKDAGAARAAGPAGETSAAAASKDSDDTAVALPGTDLTVCLACCRSLHQARRLLAQTPLLPTMCASRADARCAM
jgi:hypothetical protein